jgi:AcrR family transcriptional regulator
MAAARRSTEEDSATRTALLDAAQELMLEEGYAAVTTRRLAAHAGVNKALVYYYFGTMDDLFLALFRRGAERTLELQTQALAGPQPLWAMWDMVNRGTSNDLTSELTALANHRKALRSEITAFAHKFREVQIARIGASLEKHGVDTKDWPVTAVVFMIAGITRFMEMEGAFGLATGHQEAVEVVERLIRSVEGARRAPRRIAAAG